MKINFSEKALKIMRIVRIIVTIIITCEIIRRFATGQSTPHLILILLLLMAPYKIYQTHVVTRKEFENTGRGEEWRKIVIRSVILGFIIIIVFVTVVVLVAVNSNRKEIHSLDSISVYVEQEGDIYTEDRLVYLITQSYKKDELYKAWGMPTDKILNDNTDADVWVLSDKQQLAIYYDKNEEVTKIEILTVTASAEQTPPESAPDTITKDNGTVETFKYDNLVLEVSNVKEIRKESSFDGMETWEYDVYVVYPGATLKVLEPDTFIDEETGLDHANWAIYLSDDSRIDIDKEMKPLELNEKTIGVYDPEASAYVLGFEMYAKNGG